MKKLGIILIVMLFSLTAFADNYELEPTHTYLYFKVNHLERGDITGVFKDVTGDLKIDGKHKKNPSIEVQIKVKSIDTFNVKRDEHLLGPDFFNAKRFKALSFKSTNVKSLGGNKYEITGNLTAKGISKKITAKMTRGKTGNDPWGKYRAGGNVFFEFDRRDFKIGKKDFDAPSLGNIVKVDLYWEALRK